MHIRKILAVAVVASVICAHIIGSPIGLLTQQAHRQICGEVFYVLLQRNLNSRQHTHALHTYITLTVYVYKVGQS